MPIVPNSHRTSTLGIPDQLPQEQLEKDDIFNQSDLFELSYGIFDEGEPLGFS